MTEQIKSILQDLYSIDPKFRDQEQELVKAITVLLESKPSVVVDEAFVERLRLQLSSRLNDQARGKTKLDDQKTTFNFFTMNKFIYAGLGAALALVIAVPLSLQLKQQKGFDSNQYETVALNEFVGETRFASRGFGELAQVVPSDSARPQSGGGGNPAISSIASMGLGAGVSSGVPMADGAEGIAEREAGAKMIMPPYMPNYSFVYAGEDIVLEDGEQDVLKRQKGGNASGVVGNILSSLNLGIVDLKALSGAKIQNFTLMQDVDFGYSVYVDLMEGLVFISQNWQKWPQGKCRDEACFAQYRVRPEQMPSDEDLIGAANAFLVKMGISREGYGDPEVDASWRLGYETMQDKSQFFLEQVNIRYPLMIDGKKVFEQYGEPFGMMVSIQLADKRVAGVFNIMTKNYARSSYPVEASFDRAKKIAERGGMNPPYRYMEAGSVEKQLNLGTAEQVYMRYWQYKENESSELLVPALRFPILNATEAGYYGQNILVPLASEILDEWERNQGGGGFGGGPIDIMPLPAVRTVESASPSSLNEQMMETK